MILVLSLLGCDDAPPAEAPPAAAPAASGPPPEIAERLAGAIFDEAGSHCGSREVFFSCTVEGGKVLSVCGTTGISGEDPTISYHFGPLGSPELSFPEQSAGSTATFTYSEPTSAQAMGSQVAFASGEYRYEVIEMVGGGGPSGEANNFSGVVILKGDEQIATKGCTGSPKTAWERLSSIL